MKKLGLALLMSLLMSASYGQYGVIVDYKKDSWNNVKNNKLHVVYEEEGASSYDKALTAALSGNWNFNEIEFITYEEYEELQKIETNFFMISVDFTSTQVGRYNENLSYIYIIKGNKKGAKKGDISHFYKLASIQSGDISREIYLPVLIKHLNKSIEEVVASEIKSLGDNTKKLNVNRSKIKDNPLYLLNSDLNDRITSEQDIKEHYKGEVKIISREELSQKIKDSEDINILFCARSTTKSYLHIYSAKTGEEYYNAFNMVTNKYPAGLISFHLKKWNK
tara:strand:- start:401 stop:1237 length:837 start_codon:yes stop_codon:yes gene_type:complete